MFLFQSSFRSSGIYIFILTFKLCRKTADKKVNVNFKIYGLRDWTTNNCNKHIAQYLKKKRQSGNEIWLVNKI